MAVLPPPSATSSLGVHRPATYWGGASAGIQYISKELGGKDKMKGKKVAYVYIDIAYGKGRSCLPELRAGARLPA